MARPTKRTPEPSKPGENPDRDGKGRFVKGNTANPTGEGGGRPKGSVSITRHLREALEAQDEKQAKQLAQAIILQAAKGNGVALKAVLDRIDGPVTEKLDGTLRVIVEYGDDPTTGPP